MRFNIRMKLLLAFSSVILLTIVVGTVALINMGQMQEMSKEMYMIHTKSISAVKQAGMGFHELRGAIRATILEKDPDKIQALAESIALMDQGVMASFAEFDQLLSDTQANKDEEQIYKDTVAGYQAYMVGINQVIELAKLNQDDEAMAALGSLKGVGGIAVEGIKALVALEDDLANTAYERSGVLYSQTLTGIISITVVSILIGLVISILIANSISKGVTLVAKTAEEIARIDLENLSAATRAMAGGDLTQTYQTQTLRLSYNAKDEIGDLANSFNFMIERLQAMDATFMTLVSNFRIIIEEISTDSEGLSVASSQFLGSANQAEQATSQITVTIQQVAKGIEQQAVSISKTAVSVSQMGHSIDLVVKGAQEQSMAIHNVSEITSRINGSVRKLAETTHESTEQSALAAEVARKGNQTVAETLAGMKNIRDKVSVSAEKVREMGSRSDQIGSIVETIEDIASQTNLLALNAAIEAARAGEYGKGFAVVADEVRSLAERASHATKEIGGLIKGIQLTVVEAVKTMEDGAKEVEIGVASANKAGEALNHILEAVDMVYKQAQGAGKATDQIKVDANELVVAIDAVSSVIEKNLTATEQMSASSNDLSLSIESIASVSEEASASIEEVSASTEEMNAQVEEVSASAKSLTDMAQGLQRVVQQFTF